MKRVPYLVLCLLVATVVSCGGGGAEALPSDVTVTAVLKDNNVTLTPATAKAGTVKIGIRNSGTMAHEFELIKTDLAADKLPVDGAQAKAKTDGLVKQILNIGVGKTAVVTADLAAGHYVIICNVPGHYQLGMRADLTVQ